MKIVSKGNTLFSAETYDKKREERKRKFLLIFSGLLIVFVALILASQVEQFQIKEVEVEGAQVITEDEVEKSVKETLSGRYFWLVPKSNALLYSGEEIRENLLREFPRFSAVELSLDGAQTLVAYVAERDPFALYCPSATRPENASSCFFLDDTGFIFDEAPAFSGVVYFVYALADPLEDPEGKQFMPEDEFRSLSIFIEGIKTLGFEPMAVEVSDRERRLMLPAGATITWNADDNLTHLYANLEAFMNSETIQADKNFIDRVFSLDLRTENKVFYRFRE
jgi:hypothetical protein